MNKDSFSILVIAHDALLYGASQSLFTLLKYWKNKYDNINIKVIIPSKGDLEELFVKYDIDYNYLQFPRVEYKLNQFSFFELIKKYRQYKIHEEIAFGKLSLIVKDFQPDVIYTNTSIVSIGYRLAKHFKIPHVWHIREFGKEDYNLGYLPNYLLHKRKINKSRTISISNVIKSKWITSVNDNHVKIYNGFYDDTYDINRNLTFDNSRTIQLGILGTIMPSKGQDLAIKATEILISKGYDVILNIYGGIYDQVYYSKLITYINSNSSLKERVKFYDFIKEKDIIYQNISILLNCSSNEGFGRTLIEGMLFGRIVIGNAAGAIPEIIKPGFNGLMFDKNYVDLANQIEKVLLDNNLAQSILNNAFNDAKNNYSVTNYAEDTLAFLKKSVNI